MAGKRYAGTWLAGGFAAGSLLAVGAIAGVLGGDALAMVLVVGLVVATPIVMAMAAGAWVGGTVRQVAPAAAPAVGFPAWAAPVVARLTQVSGSCSRKVQYATGNEFTFQEGKKVTPALCGPALHGLFPYVQKLRTGENGRVARVQCPLSGTVLVFELRPKGPVLAGWPRGRDDPAW